MPSEALEKLKALKGKTFLEAPQPGQTEKRDTDSAHMNPESVRSSQIARSVALNCAAQVTEAYAHVLAATDMAKPLDEALIKGWLKSFKATEYSANLKLLIDPEEEEIPF